MRRDLTPDRSPGPDPGASGASRRAKDKLVGFHGERLAWCVNDFEGCRVGFERAGPQAVTDFYGKNAKEAAD